MGLKRRYKVLFGFGERRFTTMICGVPFVKRGSLNWPLAYKTKVDHEDHDSFFHSVKAARLIRYYLYALRRLI